MHAPPDFDLDDVLQILPRTPRTLDGWLRGLPEPWVFSNEGGGWEFPALLVVLAAAVALQGSGAYALRKLQIFDGFLPKALHA